MSGHTPGPWKAVSANAAAEIGCMEIAEVANMRVVPESGGWPTPGDPVNDARLMAAAPELLAAVRMLLTELVFTDTAGTKAAGAAITKATGSKA